MRTASGMAAMTLVFAAFTSCSTVPTVPRAADLPPPTVDNVPLTELTSELHDGRTTSVALVRQYLARIAALDASGPALRSIIRTDPGAEQAAYARDRERINGRSRGPLHGVPIAIKDNIETAGMPTTAGSLALAANDTGRDATLVARLRAGGAIVLAKTNLSEWANFRSTRSTSGWSAIGGLTRNPYALDRNACGSSSGSAVAVAASLVTAAVGTETSGSITCPAAVNGLVGLKPTVGLISRQHIVPISAAQDTAGPMTRTVADAAVLLTVLAGSDPADPATLEADARKSDYRAALSATALRGKRLGVLRFLMGYDGAVDAVSEAAFAALRGQGATLVDIAALPTLARIQDGEYRHLVGGFKPVFNRYLATTPPAVTVRTLADLIEFNRVHAATEMPYFGQEMLELAERGRLSDVPGASWDRESLKQAAGRDGIDALLERNRLHALIAPTTGPAWVSTLDTGDHMSGMATTLPAVAGYPHLTVPMGQIEGLPVGLSFIGAAWSEADLLALGYAFEQHTQARVPPSLPPVPASTRRSPSRGH